jgi:hypothetical protein
MDLGGLKELGFAGLIFIPFFFLLKWVLEETSRILARECEERAKWLLIVQGFQQSITAHTEQANSAHEKMNAEHQQMIECLGRINGYKKE